MYKLRYYQQDAVDSVYKYFENNKGNPVIAQPTGTGKSVVIAGLLKRIYKDYPGQRVMMLTHVKELISQNLEKLVSMWPATPAGVYSAGLKRKEANNAITFAGIQSVAKKHKLFGHQDLIIVDECHLVSNNSNTSYRAFFENLKKTNRSIKVIGLSATPYRLGLGRITDGGLFTDICYDNTDMEGFNRLLDEGFILPPVPKKTDTVLDLSGVHKRGGEFIPRELQAAVDTEDINYHAIKEILKHGQSRKHWLVFSTGIDHCEHLGAMFEAAGVSVAVVHSDKTEVENTSSLLGFRTGRYRALINNNKLTTGYDFAAIDLIAVLRPTTSTGLWVQMLGRGTRPVYAPGYNLNNKQGRLDSIMASIKQNCLVLDFAGNTRRLGPINDPVLPKKKGEGKGGGIAPVRLCEECNTYNHASARVCINCGYVFPKITKIAAFASIEELVAKQKPPEIVDFEVTKITYARHRKLDRPDSICVIYYCGVRRFKEWICFEHGGKAQHQAIKWWHDRGVGEAPETTDKALESFTEIREAKSIKVWINKKYPEIIGYDFV